MRRSSFSRRTRISSDSGVSLLLGTAGSVTEAAILQSAKRLERALQRLHGNRERHPQMSFAFRAKDHARHGGDPGAVQEHIHGSPGIPAQTFTRVHKKIK